MHLIKRTLNVPIAMLLAVIVSILAYQVVAQGQPGGNCNCVVSVDLPAVLEGLNQRADSELKLKTMRDERLAEDASRQNSLKAKQKQLEAIPATDVAQRNKIQEDIVLEALEYEGWRAFTAEQLDIEKSLMFRDLDTGVGKAIEELAAANGYDIVLMNDSNQELGVNPDVNVSREAQVVRQMTSRRALYVGRSADITQELVQRMNNAYNTGG